MQTLVTQKEKKERKKKSLFSSQFWRLEVQNWAAVFIVTLLLCCNVVEK
jgi:hypothetical protein